LSDTQTSPLSPTGTERKLPFALQNDEDLLIVVRRHWLYFTLRMLGVAGAGVLGTVLGIVLVAKTFGFDGNPGRIAVGVIALWALYWLVRGYFTWYRYENDLWAVTNQRIVDSADLVDVEDINVVRHGILPTMFNFGDVRCQTAGEVPNFVLSGIPKPTEVLASIDAARDASRRSLRGAF
jgi:hypothetical protein